MTKPPRPIQPDGRLHGVAVAVRDAEGRWLMVRRSANVSSPLSVCFPGGAIEIGETQEEAVVREMREELGLTVRPVRCVWKWESPDRALTLWGWLAEAVDGELHPDPHEIAEAFWLTPEQGAAHPQALPTNIHFLDALCREVTRPRRPEDMPGPLPEGPRG
jgi:8-oxo-dGTP diphosphatase